MEVLIQIITNANNTIVIVWQKCWFDSSYEEITINEENGAEMRVIGEFVSFIK